MEALRRLAAKRMSHEVAQGLSYCELLPVEIFVTLMEMAEPYDMLSWACTSSTMNQLISSDVRSALS